MKVPLNRFLSIQSWIEKQEKKINDLEKMLSNSDVDISKKLIEIIEDVYQDGYNEGGRDNRDL